jgi:hypothetical protein
MKEEQGGVYKRKKMAAAVGRRGATGKSAANWSERDGCHLRCRVSQLYGFWLCAIVSSDMAASLLGVSNSYHHSSPYTKDIRFFVN